MTVASKRKSKFSYQEALGHRASKTLSTGEQVVVTVYLLTFLFVVGVWLLDDDWAPFKGNVTEYTKWPMESFGWTQYWGLFSPDIRKCNYHSTIETQFADGTSKIYEVPRTNVDYNDFLSHFGGEKKRKLFGDNLPWSNYKQFLPSVCRFMARANNDPSNQPRMVTFVWHFTNTPPPDPKHWVYRDHLPHHTQQIILFKYRVQPQDLQPDQDAGKSK